MDAVCGGGVVIEEINFSLQLASAKKSYNLKLLLLPFIFDLIFVRGSFSDVRREKREKKSIAMLFSLVFKTRFWNPTNLKLL